MAKKKRTKKKQNAAPKLKRLTHSTGWMGARRVKVTRRRGRTEILIEKPPLKRKR